jgi:hypothetical protein
MVSSFHSSAMLPLGGSRICQIYTPSGYSGQGEGQWAVSGHLSSTGRAVERIERKLDRVIKHLGIEGPAVDGILPETLAEIDRCIWSDRRAEATRLYRQATGHTAVEAKAWIDRRVASY